MSSVFTDTCRPRRQFSHSLIVIFGNNRMFFCLLAACADNCAACTAEGKCDTCKTGFVVNGDTCVGQFICSFSYDISVSNL